MALLISDRDMTENILEKEKKVEIVLTKAFSTLH